MNAAQIVVLASELMTDPLTRGYAPMDDAAAAADLNTVYRDGPGDTQALVTYLTNTRAHTNQGTDTTAANSTPSTILGRLIMAAEQTGVGADPFGAGDTPVAKTMNSRELHSAKAFLFLFQTGLAGGIDFTSAEQGDILNDLIGAGVFNTANRTAIIALSQNKQSRGEELDLGIVSAGDVEDARA